jgi:hypothetical protein
MLSRIVVAAALVCVAGGTQARYDERYAQVAPEVRSWVEGLRDDKGHGCCATADGFKPEEVVWDTEQNNYRVMLQGQWFKVPDGAVIKEPNRLGFAMVWYYVYDGQVTIRCFLPGSGA